MTTSAMHTRYPPLAPVERIALRLGLALISWSRRSRRVTADRADRDRALLRARLEQDRDLARAHFMLIGMR